MEETTYPPRAQRLPYIGPHVKLNYTKGGHPILSQHHSSYWGQSKLKKLKKKELRTIRHQIIDAVRGNLEALSKKIESKGK